MFANKTKPAVLIVAGAAALCGGVTSLVHCSSSQAPTGTASSANNGGSPTVIGTSNARTGTVGLALNLPGGAQVNSVTYDLLNSAAMPVTLPSAPNPGTVNVSNSASIDFQLGGVPAATGDSITLTASITGGGTCQGSASGINVTAGATTTVTVQMLCSLSGPDAGNLFVTGATSSCGTWTSLSSNSSEVYVGESLVLYAGATGPNPSNLGYTWTMSNPIGAFGASTTGVGAPGQDEGVGPSDPMQFFCTAPGTTTVTLVVDDGPVDAGACPTNLSTLTTTVICDAFPGNQVESAWVEIAGPNGGTNGFTGNVAIARAVTAYAPAADAANTNPCPNITINGGTPVQMNLRAAATTSLAARSVNTPPNKPSLFPVSSCEYVLPANATSAVVAGQSLPLPKANPTKIVVIGDTGCRVQNGNGTQSCNDPNPAGTDTPYPFAAIAAAAAAQNPDLVLHVGDYAYRDNPCPAGLGFNCGGSPWGFGWDTWEADLFAPGAPLLAAAPWVMTRGNHEQCNRAGQGWYRFLDTGSFDTTDHHTCDNAADDTTAAGGSYNNPFLVQINSATQLITFDTSNAKPISGTPTTTTSAWYTTYQSELTTAGTLVGGAPLAFNLWSNHHPIFGYATATPPALPTCPIPLFPPVMNTVFPGTYFPPPINLALHGHTHDYQAIDFATGTLPDGGTFQPTATLVSGNAGDILDTALPYPLTGTALSSVGNPSAVSVATLGGVQQFATDDNGAPFQNPNSSTDNSYGYMVLQFNAGPPPTWVATEYRWDNTVRDVCTIQTSGTISCASWGVVPPSDAGVY
jgi:Calcineurin-like phosphoesterase